MSAGSKRYRHWGCQQRLFQVSLPSINYQGWQIQWRWSSSARPPPASAAASPLCWHRLICRCWLVRFPSRGVCHPTLGGRWVSYPFHGGSVILSMRETVGFFYSPLLDVSGQGIRQGIALDGSAHPCPGGLSSTNVLQITAQRAKLSSSAQAVMWMGGMLPCGAGASEVNPSTNKT